MNKLEKAIIRKSVIGTLGTTAVAALAVGAVILAAKLEEQTEKSEENAPENTPEQDDSCIASCDDAANL